MRPWEKQAWAAPYRRAVLEGNPRELPSRIDTARTAIWARIGELNGSLVSKDELGSLFDALKILRVLEAKPRYPVTVRKKLPRIARPEYPVRQQVE